MPNLNLVFMCTDVYLACLGHALSNESEEVMGLLIGEIIGGRCVVFAYESLRRLDKRKDRVEISPEQLTEATEKAEAVAKELNRPVRIVGWYHSHPHITVFPSHVDLNTQLNYQQLDEGFVGMIISVFSEDKSTKEQEIVVSCFQTLQYSQQKNAKYIKLYLVQRKNIKPSLEAMTRLPRIILQEEEELYQRALIRARASTLAKIQNQAERTKAWASIIQRVSLPFLLALKLKTEYNDHALDSLHEEICQLKEEMDCISKAMLDLLSEEIPDLLSEEEIPDVLSEEDIPDPLSEEVPK